MSQLNVPVLSTRAIIVFRTDENKKLTFSIPRANSAKSAADAGLAMEKMISTSILDSEHGIPIEPKHAKFVSTTNTRLI